MILGPKKLLQLVKAKKLVEGLSERELTNPEGAGFDLRLGEVYTISGKAFLGEIHRKTAEVKLIKKYDQKKTYSLKIKPGEKLKRWHLRKGPRLLCIRDELFQKNDPDLELLPV